jgi:hypothetical protein
MLTRSGLCQVVIGLNSSAPWDNPKMKSLTLEPADDRRGTGHISERASSTYSLSPPFPKGSSERNQDFESGWAYLCLLGIPCHPSFQASSFVTWLRTGI